MVLQISSMPWCQPGSCSPTHPLSSAPAHGGMCLGSLSDGAHHELDQGALLTVRHRCGRTGRQQGTQGIHSTTNTSHKVLCHIHPGFPASSLICHLHHLKMHMAEVREAQRNVGWRKGSMEGNIRKIYKIRESCRRQTVTDNSL